MRSLLKALAFLMLCGQVVAQDISWSRDGKTLAESATSTNSNDRQNAIRAFIGENYFKVLETDDLTIRGEADFGKDYVLPLPAARYKMLPGGCWWTRCRIDATATATKPLGTTGFVLGKGKYLFKSFYVVGRNADPNEDSGTFCHNSVCDSDVTFEDCTFDGSVNCDWGAYYNWTGGRKSVTFRRCKGSATRHFLSLPSSGGLTQTFLVEDCDITIDANGSRSFGATSRNHPVMGSVLTAVLCRGGQGTIKNSRIKVVGLKTPYVQADYGCPRIAAIFTDQFDSTASPGGKVTVDNVSVEVSPGVATVVNDVDVRYGSVSYQAGGSNADGTYKVFSK